jgi:hypothetical protein
LLPFSHFGRNSGVTTITIGRSFLATLFPKLRHNITEEKAMKSILNLNLPSDSEKIQAANVPRPENEAPKSQDSQAPPSKRLSKFVNRAAHKGALHSSRGGSGIFTK